jgi:hypothetical protein
MLRSSGSRHERGIIAGHPQRLDKDCQCVLKHFQARNALWAGRAGCGGGLKIGRGSGTREMAGNNDSAAPISERAGNFDG